MNYLSHELALLQAEARAEAQGYDTTIGQLNAAADQRDQDAGAAHRRADTARGDADRFDGEAVGFDTQADTADKESKDFSDQLDLFLQNNPEPEQYIDDPRHKPPHYENPEWTVWKATADDLTRRSFQAHNRAEGFRGQAKQSRDAAALARADANAAALEEMTAAMQAAELRRQAQQAVVQRDAFIQAKMDPFLRWQQELARQPPDRNALEAVWRELDARLALLESQHAAARDAAAATEQRWWYLRTLLQELSTRIDDTNAQISAADDEMTAAVNAAGPGQKDIQWRILRVMERKPE